MPALDRLPRPVPTGDPQAHVFAIRAEADPQVLMRIVGLFAQRSIVPELVTCRRSGERLEIAVEAVLASDEAAERLLEKLRAIVLIGDAALLERAAA